MPCGAFKANFCTALQWALPHLLSKTPHCMAAFGLMHRAKLHVVLSSVALRSCWEPKKALATVGFSRAWVNHAPPETTRFNERGSGQGEDR